MSLYDDILSLFPGAKPQTGYIRVKCPFHKNGQERRPSMSIITEEGHNGMHAGDATCFTCGWRGTFADIAENFGLQYIPETYTLAPSSSTAQKTVLQLTTQQAIYKKDTPYKYSPYLASRGIFEDVQRDYRVYEKDEDSMVYMPVFSRSGQFLYANARSTVNKFFAIPTNIKKTLAGLDLVDFSKPIGICESQINMYTLAQAQYVRAVATLGVANIFALSAIKNATGPFLLMLDGDEAGKKANDKIKSYLGAHRCIEYQFHEKEDVNDLWRNCNFNQDLFFDELEKRKVDKGDI